MDAPGPRLRAGVHYPRSTGEFQSWFATDADCLDYLDLCVPRTSSTSCDQAVFVDRATGLGMPSDAVPVEIDRFG